MGQAVKVKKRKRTKAPEIETGNGSAVRPTPERMAQGEWAMPQGNMKSQQPIVDMACDTIGRLFASRQINGSQEQAARSFQEAREAFKRELPDISGFKSCIAGSVPGYDDGDGDQSVLDRYRGLERKLTRHQRVELVRACDDERLVSLANLTSGLDALIYVDRG